MGQEKLIPDNDVVETEEGLHVPSEDNELAYLFYKLFTNDLSVEQTLKLSSLKTMSSKEEKEEALRSINAPEDKIFEQID